MAQMLSYLFCLCAPYLPLAHSPSVISSSDHTPVAGALLLNFLLLSFLCWVPTAPFPSFPPSLLLSFPPLVSVFPSSRNDMLLCAWRKQSFQQCSPVLSLAVSPPPLSPGEECAMCMERVGIRKKNGLGGGG